jgi:DNA replication protein DnaC
MQRLRLSHLPNCYEALAEEASAKDLPYLDFLEQALEAESAAKHTRNVRLKTQWAHFPYNKGLDQFDFTFQPSVDERKLRELARSPSSNAERTCCCSDRRAWARPT